MTQHILEEHTTQDTQIMRRLGLVVSGFMIATVVMAITVGAIMG